MVVGFTLWDLFRCTTPLMHVLQPEAYEEQIRSFIDIWRNEGFMPDARSSNWNGRVQGGTNADNVLADAYVKGVRGAINWDAGYGKPDQSYPCKKLLTALKLRCSPMRRRCQRIATIRRQRQTCRRRRRGGERCQIGSITGGSRPRIHELCLERWSTRRMTLASTKWLAD